MSNEYSRGLDTAYAKRLDSILSTPLSPENITSYADAALDQTVELVEAVTASYCQQPTIAFETSRDTETAAVRYFRLRDVDEILDHLSEKSEEIHSLEQLIGKAALVNEVIVPPDQPEGIRQGSGNGLEVRNTIERCKTILFLLQNDFDIDVNNPKDISLTKGIVTDSMMRQESYYSLNVPSLDRTILVCDEEGNVSYVFDTKSLNQLGFDEHTILNLSKTELNKLLSEHKAIGQRIVYSQDHFLGRMRQAIEDPSKPQHQPNQASDECDEVNSVAHDTYLYPKAPEDVLSATGLAKQLDVSYNAVAKAVKELEDELGSIKTYRFGQSITTGYNPAQQKQIEAYLTEKRLLYETASEDILSIRGIAKQLGVGQRTIARAKKELEDELGSAETYRFGKCSTAIGYNLDQQKQIEAYLTEKGLFCEAAPEDILSVFGIAKQLGVGSETVAKAVEELGDELGSIKTYRFGVKITNGYSLDQQKQIEAYLTEKGLFCEAAPEDILPVLGIAKQLDVRSETVAKAVEELGDELGPIKTYRFGANITNGYSPAQQKQIKDYLGK